MSRDSGYTPLKNKNKTEQKDQQQIQPSKQILENPMAQGVKLNTVKKYKQISSRYQLAKFNNFMNTNSVQHGLHRRSHIAPHLVGIHLQ